MDMQLETADPINLVPNPMNAKEHTKKQIKQIAASITEYGFRDPIGVDEGMNVLEGHGRLMAAKKLGLTSVPILVLRGLTDAQKRAYTLVHNKLNMNTGFDMDILKAELEGLAGSEFDLSLTGFGEDEIDKILDLEETVDEKPLDLLEDAPEFGTGVFQLSDDMILMPEEYLPPYGFPKLRDDRLAEGHEEYQFWTGQRRTVDQGGPMIYVYGSDSTLNMPTDRTTLCFYTDDQRFERVWTNLAGITTKFLHARVESLMQPNFSVYREMPLALKLYQTYRAKLVARYWQEAGLLVVPDIEFGSVDDLEFTLAGIPEGAPMCCTQLQTLGDSSLDDELRQGLGLALEKIKPVRLLVYGGEPGLRLGKEVCERHGVAFTPVMNRAAQMRADVATHETIRPF